MSRTIKNEQLYIQEEHNMFINPSLIPSQRTVSSVKLSARLVRKMLGEAAAPAARTTLSQQIDAKRRTRFGAGRGQVKI